MGTSVGGRSMCPQRIEGILFDSGDTLVRPIGGTWWPSPHFDEVLAGHGIQSLDRSNLDEALQKGAEYLNENHCVSTEDEEREQFEEYYSIVLAELGLPDPPPGLTSGLGHATVDRLEIEPFADTKGVLQQLHEKQFKLGIISNAWPSLEKKYRQLGLRGFFDVFVISSRVGCCKPADRIFEQAIQSMGLPPETLLFVDDCPEYVRKAKKLGLNGLLIARAGGSDASDLNCISAL